MTTLTSPSWKVPSTTSKCILQSSSQLSLALAPLPSPNTSMHTFTRRRTSYSIPSGKKVLTLSSKNSSTTTKRSGIHHLLLQPPLPLWSRQTTPFPTEVSILGSTRPKSNISTLQLLRQELPPQSLLLQSLLLRSLLLQPSQPPNLLPQL